MEMQRHRLTRFFAVVGLVLLALPATARGQGFGINEIGTCASSRGFAVTGSPCKDASAVFWNPAAITGQTGWSFLAGATILSINGSFKEDTTFREFEGEVPTLVVPHFFVTYKPSSGMLAMNGKAAYGFGVYVPYGLTSQWNDTFPGRFLAKKAAIASIYFQPNFAYQLNDKWSIGAGPVIGVSHVELTQGLDLAELPTTTPGVFFRQLGIARHTEFGTAKLEGAGTNFGAALGIFGKVNERWTVGARFLAPIDFEYGSATADFTQTPTGIVLPPRNAICYPSTRPAFCSDSLDTVDMDADILNGVFATTLTDQLVNTKIVHPAQLQAGFGYSGYRNWLISVDYTWTGWRRFSEINLDFAAAPDRTIIEDYNNTSSIRLGAERAFTNGAQLRLGFAGVASAAPDETVTPLLPEQDRSYMTIGGAYPFMKRFTIEGAFVKVMAGGKRGRIDERANRTSTAATINTGLYSLDANVFSFSLKANY
jgi:long-chain fatty acid transport protein